MGGEQPLPGGWRRRGGSHQFGQFRTNSFNTQIFETFTADGHFTPIEDFGRTDQSAEGAMEQTIRKQ